ncbi:MAG: hypothetical protein WAW17_21685 [Rhodococcus sp. (in: high G+C Gram-positive bacteria)]|uniref:hypothetical protein n=1 Tax=Rhodococcus sp. TaxID=1831 RepID=UPI003BAFC0AF
MRKFVLAVLVLPIALCSACGDSSEPDQAGTESSLPGSYQESDYLPVEQRSISGGIPTVSAGGTSIPVLAADWSALGGSQVVPPQKLEWTMLTGEPVVLSIAASATPLEVELNRFSSVNETGIPDESDMEYSQCTRSSPEQVGDESEPGCTYNQATPDLVELRITSPSKYMVVSSTWYPNLGSDELNSSQKVAASWALSTG